MYTKVRWAGHEVRMRENLKARRVLVGKANKETLGRPGHRPDDNTKMDLL
jgi:hypothetical protein